MRSLVLALAVALFLRWRSGSAGAFSPDQLFRARCAATCAGQPADRKCESKCGILKQGKPGACPGQDSPLLTVFHRACVTACSQDVDCPATDKCCAHSCGASCQPAIGLDTDPGLPSIPANLKVSESRRPRAQLIEWSPSVPSERVFYVLEERRHVGQSPDPRQFGPWRGRCRRRKTHHLLTGLSPAHWYQVRVAAVNPNGTRGFSLPSRPFKLEIDPNRPKEPGNLTVSRPGWVNGRLWAEVRWRRPASDLPLHHYTVFWSHCVKSGVEDTATAGCKPKSVIVNHKSVSYKKTSFILHDLEPQSLYFIQVQAVTIPYGKKKLSSGKAPVFIATNKLVNASYNWNIVSENAIKHLRVLRFTRPSADSLEAKILWQAAPGRFLVTWSPLGSCKVTSNNTTNEATTEALQTDIDHLLFNCKYQVIVKLTTSEKSARTTFTTPLCTEVNSKFPC